MQLVQRKQRQVLAPGTTKAMNSQEERKNGGGGFGIQGKNKLLHQPTDIMYNMGGVMQSTGGSYQVGNESDDTQNQFYSPIDEIKNQQVLKTKTNINNPSFNTGAYTKKRSVNLNANNDFTSAGVSHQPTKHVPQ